MKSLISDLLRERRHVAQAARRAERQRGELRKAVVDTLHVAHRTLSDPWSLSVAFSVGFAWPQRTRRNKNEHSDRLAPAVTTLLLWLERLLREPNGRAAAGQGSYIHRTE
jgi:hypothetical protein